jgi:hypothetical protein
MTLQTEGDLQDLRIGTPALPPPTYIPRFSLFFSWLQEKCIAGNGTSPQQHAEKSTGWLQHKQFGTFCKESNSC